jgi:hypothetical protein
MQEILRTAFLRSFKLRLATVYIRKVLEELKFGADVGVSEIYNFDNHSSHNFDFDNLCQVQYSITNHTHFINHEWN